MFDYSVSRVDKIISYETIQKTTTGTDYTILYVGHSTFSRKFLFLTQNVQQSLTERVYSVHTQLICIAMFRIIKALKQDKPSV